MTREALGYKIVINRIASVMLIFLVLFFALHEFSYNVTSLLSEILMPRELTIVAGILDAFAYFFSFVIPAVIFWIMSNKSKPIARRIPADITLPKYFPLFIMAGIAVTLCFAFVNSVFLEMIGYDSYIMIHDDYGVSAIEDFEYVIMFISIAIVPAFCEELLFRGVIMKNLVPYSKGAAVIVSALLFALMHQNPAQFLYTFFSGIILALVCIETGSIWCSVFIHLYNNSMSVLGDVLSTRLSGSAASYIISMMDAIVCIAGLVSIVVLIRLYDQKRKKMAECIDGGFFSKDFEQSYHFATKRVSAPELIRLFCTPAMIAFCILAIINSV